MHKKPRRIYLDNAASTPVSPRVAAAMRPYFSRAFGNPGAINREGIEAARVLADARGRIARLLETTDDSLVFTGSGTEANNLAVVGLVEALAERGRPYRDMEIIVSAIEHPSVLEPIRHLKHRGVRVIEMGVRGDGRIDPDLLRNRLSRRTVLVSVAYVNGEIGTIAPIPDIARSIRRFRKERGGSLPYFHTDACQAGLYLPLRSPVLGVDLMTLDAQKIEGPKGVGLLMRRRGVSLSPLIRGGGQEGGLRSGTENVPGIVGFAEALALAAASRERRAAAVSRVRDAGIKGILRALPGSFLNGSADCRLANNINVTVPGLDGELMVAALDAAGIAASTKSACEREAGPSHVLLAIGRSPADAASCVRLTLSPRSTVADMKRVARELSVLRDRQVRANI